MKIFTITASVTAISAALSSPVQAQNTASTAPAAASAPATAAAPSKSEYNGVADIIVTASRRSESAQRTPIAIIAVTGSELRREGVVQPQDLGKAVTGLGISPVGGATQIYLRGVGTFAVGPFSESAVAFNVDDIFMSIPQFISGQFYDLQRVEVLKGPQGTLYGRNATAGSINVISNRPDFKFSADGSLELGNYNTKRANGALNIPLSDTFAIRAAFQISQHDGYSADGYDDDNSKSGRLQALYKPNDRFSVLLAADFVNQDPKGTANHALNPNANQPTAANPSNPWESPSSATSNQYLAQANASPPFSQLGVVLPLEDGAGYVHDRAWGAHAEIKADLGFADLTVIPSYRKLKIRDYQEPGFPVITQTKGSQSSLEGRLASNSGARLKWLVGGFYFKNNQSSHIVTPQGTSTNVQDPTQALKTYAAFGQTTYALTDNLRLTGGLRYSSEKRVQSGTGTSTNYFPPPAFPFAPIVVSYRTDGQYKNSNVSYKAGIEHDLAAHSMVYASVSTGFKSGGLNPDTNSTFKPEKLTAYTIGSKNRFLDGKLQANAELFYWDYKNHQENILAQTSFGGYEPFVRNISKSTAKGVSLDLQYDPSRNDMLTAQVEYLHAVFNSFKLTSAIAPGANTTSCGITPQSNGSAIVDCSGKPFSRAPKWSAHLGYQHSFVLGDSGKIVAGATAELSSSYYIATDYLPQEKQKAFGMVDLSLAYEAPGGHWSLAGYVRNLTNHAVYNSAFEQPYVGGLVYATIRPPRTFSGVLSFHY